MTNKNIKASNNPTSKERHWVRITHFCNQNCLFCLDRESRKNENISIADIEKDLQLGINKGAKRVIISGGEASVHPDFVAIISLAKSMGYEHIQTISNGQKFSDEIFLKNSIDAGLKEITFSIHGHNSEIHDKLVGVKGAYIRALQALKNTKRFPDLIVSIDICINKLNIKQLPEMMSRFIKAGFYEFDVLQVVPFGAAWENKDILLYDLEENLKYLHEALDFFHDQRTHIWTNRLSAKFLEGYEDLIQSPEKIKDEINGRNNMFLDLIRDNKKFTCRDERCQYCFLEDFCSDLEKFVKEKELTTKPFPICLVTEDRKDSKKLLLADVYDGKSVDVDKYVDFFISERYYVKSLRCADCRENKCCLGVPIGLIKDNGFKILKCIK